MAEAEGRSVRPTPDFGRSVSFSAVDSRGAGGARATPEFGGFRKKVRKRDRQSITTSSP